MKELSGRNRRLQYEWNNLEKRLASRSDIEYSITKVNAQGMPIQYQITYHIKSICGVTNIESLDKPGIENQPLFANEFKMQIDIPEDYPCIDAVPMFCFHTKKENGDPMPHPWHPNIRFFGEMAGRVCLNAPDSYMDLVWYVERVALYLKYELYHAKQEPPYPEDINVARWVLRQGETMRWIFFNQTNKNDE